MRWPITIRYYLGKKKIFWRKKIEYNENSNSLWRVKELKDKVGDIGEKIIADLMYKVCLLRKIIK